jgi:transcription elongation factor Elf1
MRKNVKCDFCGYKKTISWQAETFKNETLLICDGCVQEFQKKQEVQP